MHRAAASLHPELSDAVALHVERASQSVITAPGGVYLSSDESFYCCESLSIIRESFYAS
jgi:hypothetical protein